MQCKVSNLSLLSPENYYGHYTVCPPKEIVGKWFVDPQSSAWIMDRQSYDINKLLFYKIVSVTRTRCLAEEYSAKKLWENPSSDSFIEHAGEATVAEPTGKKMYVKINTLALPNLFEDPERTVIVFVKAKNRVFNLTDEPVYNWFRNPARAVRM